MTNSFPKAAGFTLIEIMISIAIVGITFGVIITSAAAVRQTGRDGQRQADILAIKSALQNFYADQNYFPNNLTTTTSTDISTYSPLTNCSGTASCTPTKTYLNFVPVDPSNVAYKYKPKLDGTAANIASTATCNATTNNNQCHYYILCADLEGSSPQSSTQNGACVDATNGFGANYTYQANP